MSYRAVVDACALYPFGVRDTLLALAELEFYDVLWSERILDEMSRNLVQDRAGTITCLRHQAQILKRPPVTFDEHLDGLSRTLPRFVAAVRG